MTDREMLELAAKAAGYIVVGLADDMVAQPGNKAGGLVIRNEHGGDSLWHPRNDDGDALRLAVKLWISTMRYESVIFAGVGGSMQPSVEVSYTDDPKKATRLAITRVAAEIGRSMK